MRTFSITLYRDKQAVDEPYLVEGLSWDQLKNIFLPHAPHLDKRAVPCFAPHRLAPGGERNDKSVVAMSWLPLDLDQGWTEQELIEHLASLDCAAIYFSSWSFKRPDAIKGRLLIPLDRDVLPSEWPMVWAAGNARYAKGRADAKCKDLQHPYFIPSYLEGSGYEPQRIELDGPFASVERLILEAPPESNKRAGQAILLGTSPTKPTLGQFASKLQTSKKTEDLGKQLALVVKGEPFAPNTERNDTAWKLTGKLVSAWPALDPIATAELFGPSLSLMGDGSPDIKEMLERRQRGMTNARGARTASALGNNRREPYTLDELQILADYFGIEVSELRNRWIIQRGKYFYILVAKFHKDGTLTPSYALCSKDDVENTALKLLAPAITAQVNPEVVTDRGTRTKNAGELVRDYGEVAYNGVELDMTAQFSYYDPERKVFVEACCPLRVTEARYNPEIAKLLELIASKFNGRAHAGLLQWCAAMTLLHRPCSALYIVGPSGIGKSVLARGAARLYSEKHVSTLAEAFSDFNDTTGCPLILGDEASSDKGGLTGVNYSTSGLRQLIQSDHVRINRKNMPMATLVGSHRVWLCANNPNLLQTKERLTLEDAQAVAERFYYIDATCDDDEEHPAKTYLKGLGREKIRGWIENDEIAMHFLWLRDNIKIDPDERFIVQGQAIQLTQSITTNSGDNAAFCQWIVSMLLNPKPFINNHGVRQYIRVVDVTFDARGKPRGGRLLVNAKGMTEQWDLYMPHDRAPPDGTRISKALSAMSHKKRTTARWGKISVIAYRDVDLELLLNWAIATGFAEESAIEKGMMMLWADNKPPPDEPAE